MSPTLNRALKVVGVICLIVYLIILTRLIVFKYHVDMMDAILSAWSVEGLVRSLKWSNLIPFKTIGTALFNPSLPWIEVPTLIYNIIAFIPLGFMLSYLALSARKFSRILLYALIVSLTFELVQVIALIGTGDIDDVILNTTGALLGYAVFELANTVWLKVIRPRWGQG